MCDVVSKCVAYNNIIYAGINLTIYKLDQVGNTTIPSLKLWLLDPALKELAIRGSYYYREP